MNAADTTQHEADVVIVGAGPVGSALAIDLALAGVRTVVLEGRGRDDRAHPGTNLTNMRSMEHMRRWGATEHLRAANPVGPQFARDARFPTRGNGHMITKIPGAFADRDPFPFASASPHFGPQSSVEQGLRARLDQLQAAELRFGSAFESYSQGTDGVTVNYRAGGAEETVTAAYLVGADGSTSAVRKQMGIRLEGATAIANGTAWYIRSPQIRDLMAEHIGAGVFTWFVNPDGAGILLIAQDDEGVFQYMDVPLDDGVDGDDWELMRSRLQRAVGAEVEVEPIEGGSWRLNSLVAPRFHDGRVFLAGESAHHISVFGAFGMNTGIGDAADLGWKLTAAVKGWAGPGLLESYSAERVPVVSWIRDLTERTSKHLGDFCKPGMEEAGPEGDAIREEVGGAILQAKVQEVISVGAQLGAAYFDSPIVAADGTRPPTATFGEFVPSASPGTRAPHAWLDDGHSLYDEIALEGFTLLRLAADVDSGGLEGAAVERGVPLTVVTVREPDLAGAYEATMALVRPDHYVAWRGSEAPADPVAVIDTVRGAGETQAGSSSAPASVGVVG